MPPTSSRRFLITGRVGSGKTLRIVDLFLGAGGEPPGKDVLLLLPDQGAVRELRARILERAEGRGFLDGGLTTFEDFAAGLLGVSRDGLAGPEEESLLVRSLAAGLPESISSRLSSARFRGSFLRWISDLRELGIGGLEIREMIEAIPGSPGRLLLLADALDRLRAAEDERGLLFRDELPLRAARALELGECSFRPPRVLLVDGFHHVSGVRLRLLAELARRTPEVWVTLPWVDDADAWERGMLERTESALLGRLGLVPEPLQGGDDPLVPLFLGGADRREEIERIAREILFLVAEEGRRPRDFLVLFRDAGPYRSVVESVFRAYKIPFCGRFQVEAASTPPGRSLLDCTRIGREGVTRRTVEAFLKNRMFDVQEDWADRIAAAWEGTPEPKEGEDLLREVAGTERGFATERIEPLVRFARELDAARAGDRVRVLRDSWLEWIDPSLEERSFPACDLPLIGASVTRLARLLDFVAAAVDREPALRGETRGAVMALVEEEIARARVPYAGGCGAGVRVDDFRHGQNLRAPVVFVAGLEAGLCPRAYDPGSFWSEADRERLNETDQYRIPDRAHHADEERFLFRRACSRAVERLVLTAPAFRPDGRACAESPFRLELRRELGERVAHDRDLGAVERFSGPRSIASRGDVLPFLASRADPAERDKGGVALAAALLVKAGIPAPRGPRSFRDPVRLAEARPFRKWIGRRDEFSVTELEDFQACPYRYFAKYVLRLQESGESAEYAFPAPLEGAVLHRACEEAVRDDTDIKDLVARAFEEARGSFPERLGHRLAEEELRANLVALLHADRAFREEYGWTAHAFELRFGAEEKRPVRLAEGLRIRGRMDRVDCTLGGAFLVIDYKRSVRGRPDLERAMGEGRSLALPLYVIAAAEILARRPAGAFLLSARETRRVGFYDASLASEGIVPEAGRERGSMALGAEEFRETLRRAVESAGLAADGVRAGDFPVEPANDKVCDSLGCPYRDLCRIVLAAREEEEPEE